MKKTLQGEVNLSIILKTAYFIIEVSILFIINLLLIPLFWAISLINKNRNMFLILSRTLIRLGFYVFLIINTRKFRKDLNKIPKSNGKRVYILNHASLFDITLIFLLPEKTKIMVKESYIKIPFLGSMIKLNRNIIVKSDSEDGEDAFTEALQTINNGEAIVIFPEGTRSKDGNIGRFKTGAFRIAYDTEAEIVPIVIDSWNIVRPGNGLWFRDGNPCYSVLPVYKYEEYKNLDMKDFAKSLRKQMFLELYNKRIERSKTNKKFYRNSEFFKKIDENAYNKICQKSE